MIYDNVHLIVADYFSLNVLFVHSLKICSITMRSDRVSRQPMCRPLSFSFCVQPMNQPMNQWTNQHIVLIVSARHHDESTTNVFCRSDTILPCDARFNCSMIRRNIWWSAWPIYTRYPFVLCVQLSDYCPSVPMLDSLCDRVLAWCLCVGDKL